MNTEGYNDTTTHTLSSSLCLASPISQCPISPCSAADESGVVVVLLLISGQQPAGGPDGRRIIPRW